MTVAQLLADPHYDQLKAFILGHTGLAYYSDKDEDFATRVMRRLTARSRESCSSYLDLLADPVSGPQEMDRMVGELTIGETYFFRQAEHFTLLRRTILPDLLARNAESRRLRIWSAGCATGAEPYSISILLKSEFGHLLAGWDVSILATDINVEFLAGAREARYPAWALRETAVPVRDRCFVPQGKLYSLRPEFCQGVVFRYQNLMTDEGLGGQIFDLILCRNVLIYFSREQTNSVLQRLRGHLAPKGWLLVGYAEPNQEAFKEFETVSTPEATAYRRRSSAPEAATVEARWQPARAELDSPPPKPYIVPDGVAPRAVPAAFIPSPTVEDVRLLADSGHWVEATALSEQLMKSEPLTPAIHFTAALIHEHFGAVEMARAALRRAIYLDRNFALAHYHLGTSLQKSRENGPAERAFRNALNIALSLPPEQALPYGDSITAGELRDLAQLHLES